jgi:hypothetical protein
VSGKVNVSDSNAKSLWIDIEMILKLSVGRNEGNLVDYRLPEKVSTASPWRYFRRRHVVCERACRNVYIHTYKHACMIDIGP